MAWMKLLSMALDIGMVGEQGKLDPEVLLALGACPLSALRWCDSERKRIVHRSFNLKR
jgi:hypothetical protein